MIDFLSSWAKTLGLAVVIVSILEMLLPNNKTKKYIRMIMGIYIIFNIITPFIQNKEILNINNLTVDSYAKVENNINVNQTSMDERIEELYVEELEKDIKNKIQEKGYEVIICKVSAKIGNKQEETKITKIKMTVKKKETQENTEKENTIENKVITEVQKIKKVETTIENEKKQNETENNKEDLKTNKSDIQNIKKFLIEEYGVSEKCLEIN